MNEKNIVPFESEGNAGSFGLIGDNIIDLANDAIAEIKSKWNERALTVLRQNGEVFYAEAEAIQIKSVQDRERAEELFIDGASYLKTGAGLIDPFVEATHKPWKTMTDIRKEFRDKVEDGRKIINNKITAWKMAERRRIEAEQRKLDAEREAKERAERDKLLKQAEKAEASGKAEKAEEKRQAAESVYVPPTVLAIPDKKTSITGKGSVSGRKTWKIEILDEMELIKGVASGELPASCLNLDLKRVEAGIRRWAEVAKIKDYRKNGISVIEWENQTAMPSRTGKHEKN